MGLKCQLSILLNSTGCVLILILKITIFCASINVKMSKTIMTMNNQALETVQGIER